jgi:aspartyl-tRNA(Asn)/glutamyl-tRNA(Gln) amidotransferase subunit B
MEEDVARLVHVKGPMGGTVHSLLDINRSGIPLMEVVTEPDMHSVEQVEAYINSLQHIIRYLDVGSANMEDGAFRCDANVSVRPVGQTALSTKVEVKNMNRVRAVVRAVEYEINRQIGMVENGERIIQETRGWDDGNGITVPQRSKEEANDYRYFPEPDIPPLIISEEWIDSTKANMPELPIARRARFIEEWGLSEYDTDLLTNLRSTADYFEQVCDGVNGSAPSEKQAFAKETANWLNGEMARLMNAEEIVNTFDTRVDPENLAKLVEKFQTRQLNNNSAKQVFAVMFEHGTDPETIIENLGLGMVSGADVLELIVEKVINGNEKAVTDYRAGKDASLKFLMGQVMKATRGQADALLATEIIKQKLADS